MVQPPCGNADSSVNTSV